MGVHKWRDIKNKRMKKLSRSKQFARIISKPFIYLGALLAYPTNYLLFEKDSVVGFIFMPFFVLGLLLLGTGEKLMDSSQVYVSGFARDDLEMCDEDE